MNTRKIIKVNYPSFHQGFLGEGHMAASVIASDDFIKTDPFVLLMDDRLNLSGGRTVGGPHPHAGFETVTLVIEGNKPEWETGSFEMMTAGKGIVHTEEISSQLTAHILQLWLALPPEKRWVEQRVQKINLKEVPKVRSENGEVRVYSGISHGLTSPILNHTPLLLVDVKLNRGSFVYQTIPPNFKGLVYLLKGEIHVGDVHIKEGQVGRMDSSEEESNISFRTVRQEARFILYAAAPHRAPIIQQGPFVADSERDIPRLYNEYRLGKFPHVNVLPSDRKFEFTKAMKIPV